MLVCVSIGSLVHERWMGSRATQTAEAAGGSCNLAPNCALAHFLAGRASRAIDTTHKATIGRTFARCRTLSIMFVLYACAEILSLFLSRDTPTFYSKKTCKGGREPDYRFVAI